MFYKGGKMVAASANTDLHGYGEEIRAELRVAYPAKEAEGPSTWGRVSG